MEERPTKEQMERDDALQERLTREGDIYAKHARSIDLLMEGINPDTGRPMRYDDEGRQIQCACCPDTDVRYFCGTPLCKSCADETPCVCGECGGIDHASSYDGPTTCCDCRAVECHKSVVWDEGE